MSAPYDELGCGPLVRKADGTWWYDDTLLGTEGAPLMTCERLGDRLSLVCVRLFWALRRATEQLHNLGHPHPASEQVLTQYLQWRTTGGWPALSQEIKPAIREVECHALLRSGLALLEQMLARLKGNDVIRLVTETEGWIEHASLHLEEKSTR